MLWPNRWISRLSRPEIDHDRSNIIARKTLGISSDSLGTCTDAGAEGDRIKRETRASHVFHELRGFSTPPCFLARGDCLKKHG